MREDLISSSAVKLNDLCHTAVGLFRWAEAVRVRTGEMSVGGGRRSMWGQNKIHPVFKKDSFTCQSGLKQWLGHNISTAPLPDPLRTNIVCATETRQHTSSSQLVCEPREGSWRSITSSQPKFLTVTFIFLSREGLTIETELKWANVLL